MITPATGKAPLPKPHVNPNMNALRPTASEAKTEVKTLIVKCTDLTKVEIVFTGAWDGRLLKGVIRQIERNYRAVKYSVMREGIRQNQEAEAAAKKKILLAPATPASDKTKGASK